MIIGNKPPQGQQNPQNQPAKKPTQGGGSFFGGGGKENSKFEHEILELRQEINSLSRRIREIEERSQNIRKKVNVIDTNLLSQGKKLSTEVKIMYSEIDDAKHILEDFDNKMLLMIKEIRQCAKDQDLKVLQRYLEMWEPMRFVTRNEVAKIVKEVLQRELQNQQHPKL
jgi:seryl-tRNA synthetase